MTRAETAGIVAAMLKAWDARDLDAFVAFLTPDVVWHDLGMPDPPAVGRDAVRRFSASLLRAFPDFAYEVRGPLCIAEDGGSCLVPWTITASHTGPFDPPGFAPTGRSVRFSGFDYIVFRDGLIARIETRFDPAEAMEQLVGVRVRPRPGSWLERGVVWIQRAVAARLRGRVGSRT